jgi:hypothetical protein
MMETDYAGELATLRARVARLEHENAELRAERRRYVAPHARPELMPDEAQLRELQRIVLARYSFLRTDTNAAHFDEHFTSAFTALCYLPRTNDNSLNMRLDKSVFLDRASDALRKLGQSAMPLPLGPFVCALVAHGDIAYAPLTHFPVDQAYGLGDHSGRSPDGSGWRGLLQSRRVREPTPVEAFERARRLAGERVGFPRQIGPTW